MVLVPCSECGKQISTLASACPNCGAPNFVRFQERFISRSGAGPPAPPPAPAPAQSVSPKSGRILIVGLVLAALFAGVGYFYSSLSAALRGSTTPPPAAATAPRGADKQGPQAVDVPQDEQNFVRLVSQYVDSYTAAANDKDKGALRAQRAQAICALLQNRIGVSDWVGTISTFASNAEGKGVLGLNLSSKPGQASAGQVTVGTWNNDLSDVSDDTLIPPGSPILKRVAAMGVGALVRFSGNFFPSHTDCVEEQSVTTVASMLSPEFTFRFSDVEPYSSEAAGVGTVADAPSSVAAPVAAPPLPPSPASTASPTSPASTPSTAAKSVKPSDTPSAPQPASKQTSSSAALPPEVVAFDDGHSDRVNWENWVASVHGAERRGALYWAGQSSSTHPGSCEHAARAAFRNGTPDEAGFVRGCQEAQIRLVASDIRLKSEPLYRAGWNAPVATQGQSPATEGHGTPQSQ